MGTDMARWWRDTGNQALPLDKGQLCSVLAQMLCPGQLRFISERSYSVLLGAVTQGGVWQDMKTERERAGSGRSEARIRKSVEW